MASDNNVNVSENVEKKKHKIGENIMGTMSMNKLVLSMAVPMMISNLVQALYNVVDSMYVSRITTNEKVYDATGKFVSAGTDAISALGLAFPIQILIIAFAIGTSIGVNAVLSKALGAKNRKLVNAAATNGIFLMVVSYVISLIIGVFFAEMVIAGQGATGRKLEYGVTYLRIVCCMSLALYMEIIFERLLQSTGRSKYSMISQVAGAIINVIMDPILIFGLLGAPKLGVAGAAYATVFGQIVATCIGLYLNVKKNPDLHISFKGFKPDLKVIGMIYTVGFPAIIMQAVGSVMNFGMNKIILSLDDNAVAVFTAYYKIQSFFFMPIFGLSSSMVPIVAFNYGAKKKKRMMKGYKISLLYAFIIISVGLLAFEIIPDKLLMIFNTGDDNLIRMGVPAFRMIGVHFLIAWFCIITGSLFQALGNGVYSMINSLMRQLVVLLPAAYILGKIGGIDMLWWCFPIAEIASGLCTGFFYFRIKKKIIDKIPNGDEKDNKPEMA
ncbi:MAG: MATE family efflux transporter [Lachnospiraceae bacterium]|nr:MATE family efflux transporter [Lachnospiraceae bacterium]